MSVQDDKPEKSGGFFSRWRKKTTPDRSNQSTSVSESTANESTEPSVSEAIVQEAVVEKPEENTEATDIKSDAQHTQSESAEALAEKDIAEKDTETPSEQPHQHADADATALAVEVTTESADKTAADETSVEYTPKPDTGFLASWKRGLNKTGALFGGAMGSLLRQKTKIDDDLLDDIETQLLVADVGLETSTHILNELKKRVKAGTDEDLYQVLKAVLVDILSSAESTLNIRPDRTNVLMVVGVNGVGKTTSIGKLAHQFKHKGLSTTLAAGDTFRAAAVEQLQVWGERNGIPVVAQSTGSDSASVIYDALESSRARKTDVLIADTAGRLHNKSNLMEELSKVVRVMQKQDESAPHETLLVLDACTGQNAINQAVEFKNAVPLTGLILTKMDGTAKGGVIFSLIQQVGLPVKFVGLGEGIEDLAEFDPRRFVDALFAEPTSVAPVAKVNT